MFVLVLETGFSIAEASPELTMEMSSFELLTLLPLPTDRWYYRCVSPHPAGLLFLLLVIYLWAPLFSCLPLVLCMHLPLLISP